MEIFQSPFFWTTAGLVLDSVGVIAFAFEAYKTMRRLPKGALSFRDPKTDNWPDSKKVIVAATVVMVMGFILQIYGAWLGR